MKPIAMIEIRTVGVGLISRKTMGNVSAHTKAIRKRAEKKKKKSIRKKINDAVY